MGGTTLALGRRRRNASLFARIFQGRALDVGGGNDPLECDAAWPQLRDVIVWDLPHDGHDLSSFPNNSFDVVYSSHCIEHLRCPPLAVAEWCRVLRPGGHLVIVAPDFLLYEHEVWPPAINPDHKWAFSTATIRPPGVFGVPQLLDLVTVPYRLVSLQLLADGFDAAAAAAGTDLTATGACECGIELIAEKLALPGGD